MNGMTSSIYQTPRSPFLSSISRTSTPSPTSRRSTPFSNEIERGWVQQNSGVFSRIFQFLFPCCYPESSEHNMLSRPVSRAGCRLVPHAPLSFFPDGIPQAFQPTLTEANSGGGIHLNEFPFNQTIEPIPSPDLFSQQPSLSQTPIESGPDSPAVQPSDQPKAKVRRRPVPRELGYVSQDRVPGTIDGHFTRSTQPTTANIRTATQKQVRGQPVLSPAEQELQRLGIPETPNPTIPMQTRSSNSAQSQLRDSLTTSRTFHDRRSREFFYYGLTYTQ